MAETSRRKRALLSILIVTEKSIVDDEEKYIVDDEVVWSNIKLLVFMSLSVLSAQQQGKEQMGVSWGGVDTATPHSTSQNHLQMRNQN